MESSLQPQAFTLRRYYIVFSVQIPQSCAPRPRCCRVPSRAGAILLRIHSCVTSIYSCGQVKVYELSELSMKFERHMDCETVQFEILSDDYSKMVFLQVCSFAEISNNACVCAATRACV